MLGSRSDCAGQRRRSGELIADSGCTNGLSSEANDNKATGRESRLKVCGDEWSCSARTTAMSWSLTQRSLCSRLTGTSSTGTVPRTGTIC